MKNVRNLQDFRLVQKKISNNTHSHIHVLHVLHTHVHNSQHRTTQHLYISTLSFDIAKHATLYLYHISRHYSYLSN